MFGTGRWAAIDKTALAVKIANYIELFGDIAKVPEFAAVAHIIFPARWGGVAAESASEAMFLRNVSATFRQGSVFQQARRFSGNIVIQRSDIPFSVENVRRMNGGYTPFVKNHLGEWERVHLHHIGRENGKLIEVLETHNRYDNTTGGPLHIPGSGGPVRDSALTPDYWRQRLQDAINEGLVSDAVLRKAGLLRDP